MLNPETYIGKILNQYETWNISLQDSEQLELRLLYNDPTAWMMLNTALDTAQTVDEHSLKQLRAVNSRVQEMVKPSDPLLESLLLSARTFEELCAILFEHSEKKLGEFLPEKLLRHLIEMRRNLKSCETHQTLHLHKGFVAQGISTQSPLFHHMELLFTRSHTTVKGKDAKKFPELQQPTKKVHQPIERAEKKPFSLRSFVKDIAETDITSEQYFVGKWRHSW